MTLAYQGTRRQAPLTAEVRRSFQTMRKAELAWLAEVEAGGGRVYTLNKADEPCGWTPGIREEPRRHIVAVSAGTALPSIDDLRLTRAEYLESLQKGGKDAGKRSAAMPALVRQNGCCELCDPQIPSDCNARGVWWRASYAYRGGIRLDRGQISASADQRLQRLKQTEEAYRKKDMGEQADSVARKIDNVENSLNEYSHKLDKLDSNTEVYAMIRSGIAMRYTICMQLKAGYDMFCHGRINNTLNISFQHVLVVPCSHDFHLSEATRMVRVPRLDCYQSDRLITENTKASYYTSRTYLCSIADINIFALIEKRMLPRGFDAERCKFRTPEHRF